MGQAAQEADLTLEPGKRPSGLCRETPGMAEIVPGQHREPGFHVWHHSARDLHVSERRLEESEPTAGILAVRRSGGLTLLGSGLLCVYPYLGYPLLIKAVAAFAPGSATPATDLPSVSVVIAAYNEEAVIGAKVANALALDYPADRLEVIVVADGSDDSTAELARRAGATVLWHADRRGKTAALNRGAVAAGGEVLCFTDANCALTSTALTALVAPFSDPRVGVVSGAKAVFGTGAKGSGEGLYWRYEHHLKSWESCIGVTMGSPGEITGVRRSAFRAIPETVINDDFYLACDALERHLRVAYASGARSTEEISFTLTEEWERRTRIAAGTWQTVLSHPSLGSPARGWTAVAFISHRVLRTMVVPIVLPLHFCMAWHHARRSSGAKAYAVLQTLCYALGAGGVLSDARSLAVPFQFVFTNAAALRGGFRYLTGRQPRQWERAERRTWSPAPSR